MNIIDITDILNENSKIVAVKDNILYIYKGISISENIYAMDMYSYNLLDKELVRLSKQSIVTNNVCDSVIRFSNNILIKSIFNNKLIINKLDIETREVTFYYDIGMDYDTYINSVFLSEDYLLYFIDESDCDALSYDVKKDAQSGYVKGYLADIHSGSVHEIKDRRLAIGIRDNIIKYDLQGKSYIMFEEAYMDDYEQEQHYALNLDLKEYYREGFRESINVISLDELVYSIKSEVESISFKEIHKTEKMGWTRYLSMDNDSIFYRSKDFNTSIERIYSVNKATHEKRLLETISHAQARDKDIRYSDNMEIYSIEELSDTYHLKGLFNSDIDLQYSKENGKFDKLIDNRYLITDYWIEDNLNNYTDYTIIKDLKTGVESRLVGCVEYFYPNIYLF